MGQERRLLHVFYRHLDLVVARECVKEAEEVAHSRRIHDLVNAQKREGVLRAELVEAREVDAHAFLASFLRDEDGIGQPLRVPYFPYDTCFL